MRKTKEQIGPTPPPKKARKQEGEPSLSRLTARQLAVARLVSSYKYECKKVFHAIEEQQRRWSLEIDARKQRQSVLPDFNNGSSFQVSDRFRRVDGQTHASTPAPDNREPWKQSEREILKRCFLSYGFGRWQEIEMSVRKMQRTSRHNTEDMECACWELVSKLEQFVEGKEKEYLRQKLDSVATKMPFHSAGVPWAKYQTSARIWSRRLQLLDNIRLVKNQMIYPSLRSFFKDSLRAMSDTNPPACWWCPDADLLLICGAFIYGYGNYDGLKSDPEFCRIYKKSCKDLGETDNLIKALDDGSFIIPDWPATDLLTKRLKRVTDILIKTQQKNKNKPMMIELNDEKVAWTKYQKLHIVSNLMSYGLPLELSDSNQEMVTKDWTKLMKGPYLKDLSLIHGQALSNEILADMESILLLRPQEKQLEEDMEDSVNDIMNNQAPSEAVSSDVDYEVLHIESAGCLRGRLMLFRLFKSHLHLLKDQEFVKKLKMFHQGIPDWWICGIHDYELVLGIFAHGLGSWPYIFVDTAYSFSRCLSLYAKQRKNIAELCTSLESSPIAAAEKMAVELGVDFHSKSDYEDLFPDTAWITQRIKHLGLLMNENSAVQENLFNKRVGLSHKGNSDPKTTNIAKDLSGGLVSYPLNVSPLLFILNLGIIEYTRPVFHSEKLIYPIGYQSKRRIESKNFICEVLDGGNGPIFQVVAENDATMCFKHETLHGVWNLLLNHVPEAKRMSSGEELFGFSYPSVMGLIQNLPNANKCIHRSSFDASHSIIKTESGTQSATGSLGGGLSSGKSTSSEAMPEWLSRLSGAVGLTSYHGAKASHAVPYHGIVTRPAIRAAAQQRAVLLLNPCQGVQTIPAVQQLQQSLHPGSYWQVKPCVPISVKDPTLPTTAQTSSAAPAGSPVGSRPSAIRVPPLSTPPSLPTMPFSRISPVSTDSQKWSSVFPMTTNAMEGSNSAVPAFNLSPAVAAARTGVKLGTANSSESSPVTSQPDHKPSGR